MLPEAASDHPFCDSQLETFPSCVASRIAGTRVSVMSDEYTADRPQVEAVDEGC